MAGKDGITRFQERIGAIAAVAERLAQQTIEGAEKPKSIFPEPERPKLIPAIGANKDLPGYEYWDEQWLVKKEDLEKYEADCREWRAKEDAEKARRAEVQRLAERAELQKLEAPAPVAPDSELELFPELESLEPIGKLVYGQLTAKVPRETQLVIARAGHSGLLRRELGESLAGDLNTWIIEIDGAIRSNHEELRLAQVRAREAKFKDGAGHNTFGTFHGKTGEVKHYESLISALQTLKEAIVSVSSRYSSIFQFAKLIEEAEILLGSKSAALAYYRFAANSEDIAKAKRAAPTWM